MKSAGYYFMHAGQRIWRATKAEITALAQDVADTHGKRVTVRPAGAAKAPAAGKPKPRVMKRNPLDLHIPAYADAEQRARRTRLDYIAATKGRRLAKSLRGRDRGGAVKAAERAAAKTGKFVVEALGSINGRKEKWTLYRPSRSAAETLANALQAAGHKVSIREV